MYFVFLFPYGLFFLPVLHAEDVNLSTYYPSPYGNYKQIQIQEDSGNLKTDFTRAVTKAGINIITTYVANNFTPGIFWSTSGAINNPDRPKAGLWMQETAAGSLLYLGTSNNYATGITNDGIVLDQNGNVDISGQLQVAGTAMAVKDTQGGEIELGGNTTTANPVPSGKPYIDFHYGRGVAEDFNARIINRTDGVLDIVTSTGGAAPQTRISLGNNIGIGTNAPNTRASVDIAGAEPILIPRFGTDPTTANSVNGMIYYNNASQRFRRYENGAWGNMGTGGGGSIREWARVLWDNSTNTATIPVQSSTITSIVRAVPAAGREVWRVTSSLSIPNRIVIITGTENTGSSDSPWDKVYMVENTSNTTFDVHCYDTGGTYDLHGISFIVIEP